ncbi:MAG: glutathione S-transferase family protein [Tsuneonella suprasediminis]
MIDPAAELEITAFEWVPKFAQGYVRDLRLRWACEEAKLPYSERLISAVKRPEWYFAEQPWGQVPVLRDGEITVFESGACLMHLGEKSEALLPRDPAARARVVSWLFAALNSLEPLHLRWAVWHSSPPERNGAHCAAPRWKNRSPAASLRWSGIWAQVIGLQALFLSRTSQW